MVSNSQVKGTVHQVVMPMHRPFGHARAYRQLAESIVVRIEWGELVGWGEGVPREYVTGETMESAFDALRSIRLSELFSQLDLSSLGSALSCLERLDLPGRLLQDRHLGLAASCALELAIMDLLTRRLSTHIGDAVDALGMPEPLRDCGSPQPFAQAWDTKKTLEEVFARSAPFVVLKLKVGLGEKMDLQRAHEVRAAAPPGLTVCADANNAWQLDEATHMIEALLPFGIAWYEEPLAQGALSDCRELRRRTGAPIMLDESVCTFAQGRAAIQNEACDLFNIRLSKCGGVIRSLRLIEFAHQHGIGFQLGTHPGQQSILRAAEWRLANALAGFVSLEAVPSHLLLAEELVDERLEIDPSRMRCVPLLGDGLGVSVVRERLERWTRKKTDFVA